MRLLNVHSYTLREYSDEVLGTEPQVEDILMQNGSSKDAFIGYAILSHQWTKDEVTFHRFPKIIDQLHNVKDAPVWPDESNPKMITGEEASIYKLAGACAMTRDFGLNHIWIDTICIDKRSSSELSEAINSMYRWYEESSVCFAYLFGLHTKGRSAQQYRDDFKMNSWFTRGWTLQELLCPRNVLFYDHDWRRLGTKYKLAEEIEKATQISTDFLGLRVRVLRNWASTAQKMSWLSRRTTSKIEDMAYCMLGLLDINMSLLYGEREKAFLRLQRKILKSSTDESIFVWKTTPAEAVERSWGLLAPHPRYFRESGACRLAQSLSPWGRPTYKMTNRGLEYHIAHNPASKQGVDESNNPTQLLELNCSGTDLSPNDKDWVDADCPRYHVKVVLLGWLDAEKIWRRFEPDKFHMVAYQDVRERNVADHPVSPTTIVVPQGRMD